MENVNLKAEPRTRIGTRESRKMRKEGYVPGIIYGHGGDPEAITLVAHDVEVSLAHGARTLSVELGGKTSQYLIKEVQYDHLGIELIHIDLTRVDLTERVKVMVGIELRGEPKGAHEGGILDQLMAEIEVECLVTDIPDTLHPFVTELGVGDSLLVKDLEFTSGVVPLADPAERVAMVHAKAAAEQPEEVEAEEGTPSEPEMIGRARKEEEEAGDKSD